MPTAIQEYVALHAIATLPALPRTIFCTCTGLSTAVITPNNQNESSTSNEVGIGDKSQCVEVVDASYKVHRKQYSVCEKLAILKKVKKMVEEEKLSIRTAAGMFSLSPSQITRWRKIENKLSNFRSKMLVQSQNLVKRALKINFCSGFLRNERKVLQLQISQY